MYSNTLINIYLNKIIDNKKNENKFNNIMDINFLISNNKIQDILIIKKEGTFKNDKGYLYDKLNIKSNNLLY